MARWRLPPHTPRAAWAPWRPARLFAPDAPRHPGLFGPSSHIFERDGCRYPWAAHNYEQQLANFWKPEEVPLVEDRAQFQTLAPAERRAFLHTNGFLIYLDGIQATHAGTLAQWVAAPELRAALEAQALFENLHDHAYEYILVSVTDPVTRDEVYTLWREHPQLARRNAAMVRVYEAFRARPSLRRFLTACFADLLIEGVYFLSGFAVFLTLARRGRLGGVAQIIRLILRDERLHLALYTQLLRTARQELPAACPPPDAWVALAQQAAAEESAWMQAITENQFLGLPIEHLTAYVQWLTNQRLQALDLPRAFPAVTQHPLPWIDRVADVALHKTDFFEQRVINYKVAPLRFDDV